VALDELQIRQDLAAFLEAQAYMSRRTPDVLRSLMRKACAWLYDHGIKSEAKQMEIIRTLVEQASVLGPGEQDMAAFLGNDGNYESLMRADRLAQGVLYVPKPLWKKALAGAAGAGLSVLGITAGVLAGLSPTRMACATLLSAGAGVGLASYLGSGHVIRTLPRKI
jgi:hypothetical protein